MKNAKRQHHRRRGRSRRVVLTAFCWALALIMLALGAYVAWWYIDLGRIQRAAERYAGLYSGGQTAAPTATTAGVPEITAEPTPQITPTPEVTAEPTLVATAEPTPQITPTPVATAEPTPVMTEKPTPVASAEPSPDIAEGATPAPPANGANPESLPAVAAETTLAPLPVLTTGATLEPLPVVTTEATLEPLPVLTAGPTPEPAPDPTPIPLPPLTPTPTPGPFGADMPTVGDVLIPTPGADTLVYALPTAPPVQSGFDALLALNPETVGFLEIEDMLALPVAQRENDNDYYLSHTFEGDEAQEGALFLDGMNRLVPEDDCLIVYGHNMKNKTMFGRLNAYGDVNYLRRHSVVRFDTLYENRRYVAFAAFTASMDPRNARYFDVRQFIFDEAEFDKFVLKLQSRSLCKSPIDVRYGDRLLLLVTCDHSRAQSRFILALRQLRPGETEDDVRAQAMTTVAK